MVLPRSRESSRSKDDPNPQGLSSLPPSRHHLPSLNNTPSWRSNIQTHKPLGSISQPNIADDNVIAAVTGKIHPAFTVGQQWHWFGTVIRMFQREEVMLLRHSETKSFHVM